jgi:energy-coupling factor transporter ATP-binding protein EcfA2
LHQGDLYLQPGGDLVALNLSANGKPRGFGPVRPTEIVIVGDRGPVADEYVRLIRACAGSISVQEYFDAPSSAPAGGIDPQSPHVFQRILNRVPRQGHFDRPLLLRYHAALNHLEHKHFVLLAGISGTGKTTLARAYAAAVLGTDDPTPADGFWLIPVRPDWTEPAHLFGYVDTVEGRFVKQPFLRAVEQAAARPDRPVFVCLDEMNLAQPEYYFADVLSAMEVPGSVLHLHAHAGDVGVPPALPWPRNLYLTGTVNVDETTRPFSPKVLDRAQVLDLSDTVSLAEYADGGRLADRLVGLPEELRPVVHSLLTDLHAALEPLHLHFGYRTVNEIAAYLAMAVELDAEGWRDALDRQVEQKILTKLRGGDTPAEQGMLRALEKLLIKYPRSTKIIQRMRDDAAAHGSFQYWR